MPKNNYITELNLFDGKEGTCGKSLSFCCLLTTLDVHNMTNWMHYLCFSKAVLEIFVNHRLKKN